MEGDANDQSRCKPNHSPPCVMIVERAYFNTYVSLMCYRFYFKSSRFSFQKMNPFFARGVADTGHVGCLMYSDVLSLGVMFVVGIFLGSSLGGD